jgi:hypothetical protein
MNLPRLAAMALCSTPLLAAPAPHGLRVSANHHFLVQADGRPFFYLGDTAWELFHRLNREEADSYLRDRRRKGFTVIQAVALAELDGLDAPNAYGFCPLIDHDPTRPAVRAGADNDYWDHLDYVIDRANALGLVVGLLPTWGDKWMKAWGVGPEIFTPENARVYGEWIGRRYRDKAIIWILGGDRWIETDAQRAIIVAMAEGLHAGDGGTHLITFHPSGGRMDTAPITRATPRRLSITIARRSNPSSTASRSTRIIRSPSMPGSLATLSQPTCAARFTGICSMAPAATPTGITPCGRCMRRAAIR